MGELNNKLSAEMTKAKIQSAYDQRPDATGPIEITLPIMPPSTNNLYLNLPGKGRVRSKEYTSWTAQMGLLLNAQCKVRMPVRANLLFYFESKNPNKDVSNGIKAVEDLLVKVGILKDDRAAYVRSVSGTWTDIEGVRIEILPVAQLTRGRA